jgi:hypothetical protein
MTAERHHSFPVDVLAGEAAGSGDVVVKLVLPVGVRTVTWKPYGMNVE